MYKLISRKELKKYIPEAVKHGVSKVSRSNGFTYHYLNDNEISNEWLKKRDGFIKRTLPQYNNNPTYRRFLSLVMWSYKPPIKHIKPL